MVPRAVGAAAERMIGMSANAARLRRAFTQSHVPMTLVDDQRRHLDANTPARLAFRLSREELCRLRIDDVTPASLHPVLEKAWARLMSAGVVAGPYEVAMPDGTRWAISYYALANALPGQHLIAFAPEWMGDGDGDLLDDADPLGPPEYPLSPRELEVLALASEGRSGPMIAHELVVSPATVRTHFEHIYSKLGVSDRGAAVARGMRLGLID